ATEVLWALGWFLAFARGAWCGPLLSVGRDSQASAVWRYFSSKFCDLWMQNMDWFAHQRSDSIQQLWPLFMRRWSEPLWRKTLTRSIWWYVGAAQQSGGSDASSV